MAHLEVGRSNYGSLKVGEERGLKVMYMERIITLNGSLYTNTPPTLCIH
jgi:hypothetical protein